MVVFLLSYAVLIILVEGFLKINKQKFAFQIHSKYKHNNLIVSYL